MRDSYLLRGIVKCSACGSNLQGNHTRSGQGYRYYRETARRRGVECAPPQVAVRADLVEAEVDLSELERASEAYERQVSEAVGQDEETEAYVQELERRRDTLGEDLDVPSGDALAAELTRFLREHEARQQDEAEET